MYVIQKKTPNILILDESRWQRILLDVAGISLFVGLWMIFFYNDLTGITVTGGAFLVLVILITQMRSKRIMANRKLKLLKLGKWPGIVRRYAFDKISHLEIVDSVYEDLQKRSRLYSILRIVFKDGNYIDTGKDDGQNLLKLMKLLAEYLDDVPLRGAKIERKSPLE